MKGKENLDIWEVGKMIQVYTYRLWGQSLATEIYIIIPKCACVCLSVCLFVQVLFENG